jgi:phage/plasmid-like protein (TIGR03299 family)
MEVQSEVDDEYRAVVRSTDAKVLGVVGKHYRPIQNATAFSFFDALVGEGKAIYHTAGSLRGGKRVWVLAKLPGDMLVGTSDVVQKFLLLSTSHDGTLTLGMQFTPVRVVCQNTLNMALRGNADRISIRHVATAEQRIEEAVRAVKLANEFYAAFNQRANELAQARFTPAMMTELAERFFPVKGEDKDEAGALLTKKRAEVVRLFDAGLGHDKIAGTAWAAINAVAEYVDHHATRRGDAATARDSRLFHLWYGNSIAIKERALDIVENQLTKQNDRGVVVVPSSYAS